jgi:tetratricopeptide (TPR) repeat protein
MTTLPKCLIETMTGFVVASWFLTSTEDSSAYAQSLARCDRASGAIVSLQGEVEVRPQGQQLWQLATLGDQICPGDTVRVGEYGRAGLTLLEAGEIIRLDQKTTVRLPNGSSSNGSIQEVSERSQLFLDLFAGVVQFFSNQPKNLDIRTPFLNAGVEGTEFLVSASSDESSVIVFQGRVNVNNPHGQITLTDNQAAFARAGSAPMLQAPVVPRNAVRWALFYPPVQIDIADPHAAELGDRQISGPLAGNASTLPAVREAHALQRQGRLSEAIARLGTTDDQRAVSYRVGLLLSVGRRDEARPILDRLLGMNPGDADVLALSATIAVADNDAQLAWRQASQAVDLDPQSVTARIALSYAYQALFDLSAAREQLLRAVEIEPTDALAWARLSELQLSLGYRRRAVEAAERAVGLAPDLGRTQSVLGFAALAALDTVKARDAFNRAMLADSADPLPRLGYGLEAVCRRQALISWAARRTRRRDRMEM